VSSVVRRVIILVVGLLGCAAGAAPTVESTGTAERGFGALEIRVTREGGNLVGQDLDLTIDGQPRGQVPGRFGDVAAGARELTLGDDDGRYEKFSERVTIERGKVLEFKPHLVVDKGLVTLVAGSDPADFEVFIKKGADELRGPVKLPIHIELRAKEDTYAVFARSKTGAEQEFPIDFSDGVAERTFRITFVRD
jgi:hypothetical protein